MIRNILGYIRVSTLRQGQGVSLEVQKREIERYAKNNNYNITKWYKEERSASKGNRPEYNKMIAELYAKKADGCVFHKIDRIARNNKDWLTMSELADAGYDICSASENINLKDNASRFTADIQSVLATHYSRNLRQETMKGLYGRLAQGIYPFNAPVGYLNNGAGKVKTLDPIKTPLVKLIFEMYTEQELSTEQITKEMKKKKLRNSVDKPMTLSGIINILKNPFYTGMMRVKGELYQGKHEPLISLKIFERTQELLKGKANRKIYQHNYLFRKMVRCAKCNYRLVGEKQKGNVYYRCHNKCLSKCIREDKLDYYVKNALKSIEISKKDIAKMDTLLNSERNEWLNKKTKLVASLNLQISNYDSRLDKLTDALIDDVIDKDAYQMKREKIVSQQRQFMEEKESLSSEKTKIFSALRFFLELLNNVVNTYLLAKTDEKRDLLKNLFSNLTFDGNQLVFSTVSIYSELANRDNHDVCPLTQVSPRTKIVFQTNKSSAIVPSKLSDKELQKLYQRMLEKASLLQDKVDTHEYEL